MEEWTIRRREMLKRLEHDMEVARVLAEVRVQASIATDAIRNLCEALALTAGEEPEPADAVPDEETDSGDDQEPEELLKALTHEEAMDAAWIAIRPDACIDPECRGRCRNDPMP